MFLRFACLYGSVSIASVCCRLVRACLGSSAIADKKLESANPLVVLGIEVHIHSDGLHVSRACVFAECLMHNAVRSDVQAIQGQA